MYSHCSTGGWILGNVIDGTQAEFVRIPYADTSLYSDPEDADEEALVMLSDILPTGFECGVLNGKVAPGSTWRLSVQVRSAWLRCAADRAVGVGLAEVSLDGVHGSDHDQLDPAVF